MAGVRIIERAADAPVGWVVWVRKEDGLMITGRANSRELHEFRKANQTDATDWAQIYRHRAGHL